MKMKETKTEKEIRFDINLTADDEKKIKELLNSVLTMPMGNAMFTSVLLNKYLKEFYQVKEIVQDIPYLQMNGKLVNVDQVVKESVAILKKEIEEKQKEMK